MSIQSSAAPPPDGYDDTFVAGLRPDPTIVREIEGRSIECHIVGDCPNTSTGTLAGAIHDGLRAGMTV